MIETFTGRAIARCDRCAVQIDLGPLAAWRQRGSRLPSGWLPMGNRHVWCPIHQPTLTDFGLADVYGVKRAA